MKTSLKKVISTVLVAASALSCFAALSISAAAEDTLITGLNYSPSPKVKERLASDKNGDYNAQYANMNNLGENNSWSKNRIIVYIPEEEYEHSTELKLTEGQYIDLVFTEINTIDKLRWVYTTNGFTNHDGINKISIEYMDDTAHEWKMAKESVDINTTNKYDGVTGDTTWYYQDITFDTPVTTSIMRVNLLQADTNRSDESRMYYTICHILPYGTYSSTLTNPKNLLRSASITTNADNTSDFTADQYFTSCIADNDRATSATINVSEGKAVTELNKFTTPYTIEFDLDKKYTINSMDMFTLHEAEYGINEADIQYFDYSDNTWKVSQSLNFSRAMYSAYSGNERNYNPMMDYVIFDNPFVTDKVRMVVKSAKTYEKSFRIYEMSLYGEEYIAPEPELKQPEIENEIIGVYNDKGPVVDADITDASGVVTGILTTVTPNDYTVNGVTWTYEENTFTATTSITGGSAVFGVIVDGKLDDLNKFNVTCESVEVE